MMVQKVIKVFYYLVKKIILDLTVVTSLKSDRFFKEDVFLNVERFLHNLDRCIYCIQIDYLCVVKNFTIPWRGNH